jgi:predicted alpha/beta-hydrolase family hydrolase
MARTVRTPMGDARLITDGARDPWATLTLGPGAGGGIGARDLAAVAAGLPRRGVTVVRIEPPWRVAGRKVAPRTPIMDEAWMAALEGVSTEGPLVVGGRSAGARVACRTALMLGAPAVVSLAFPLHPPGKPERTRLHELVGSGVPTLVLQGERDTFGRPEEFPDGPFDLVPVAHADHGMAVPKAHDQAATLDRIVRIVGDWLGNVLAGTRR